MVTLVAQISPERSTQYADLASTLAPAELRLSPLGGRIGEIRPLQIAGHGYLQFELPAVPDAADGRELALLAMTGAYFEWFERLGEHQGPFLRPIEARAEPAFPPDLLTARRYRGKTNELLTQFMLNVARYSSAFAGQPWETLQVFDPLAGGGTTLFAALLRGAAAAGVELAGSDVESTATFLGQYLRELGVHYTLKEERLRQLGHRWSFGIGKGPVCQCVLAKGDTARSKELIAGFKPHLIVTDLPYGIQHHGELTALLRSGLPAWAALLQPGGALVFSWDATRFTRDEMVSLVTASGPWAVLGEPPYDGLGHRVDRVIKRRDVLVACVTPG